MGNEYLRIALQAAVPLHIIQLQGTPWSEMTRMASDVCQMIAEHGDLILFKSKKQGESAKAFNALARGVAILSYVPGGVTFLGDHWETVE